MKTSTADSRIVRFLLVEDNDDHAMLVQRSLQRSTVANSVERVADGVRALHYLRREGEFSECLRPDVVLLDLKLPKLDGHEVLSIIKTDPAMQAIPVVVLTTSATEADRVRAYASHANSYLVKPLDFTQFQQVVQDLTVYWGVWNQRPAERIVD
ncbi:MAG: response regulator [Planctomycetia bacterium]|nr:response regulator [Planctomycetia bacterium]